MGTPCRDASGICDLAETCTGTSDQCPTDLFVSNTTVCRAAAGACDLAETCTGSAATCPADAKSTAECRAAAGGCDVAESCNGSSNACPADGYRPSGFDCRAAAGECDVVEECSGSSAACPADGFDPAGTACGGAVGPCADPATCTGGAAACPPPTYLPATEVCRAASGSCDVAESCTGVSDQCPANGYLPADTECRAAAGPCDVAESCTGSSGACPANGLAAGGTVCRAADGDCDVAETCTGSASSCPTDQFVANGTACDDANACTATDECLGGNCIGSDSIITVTPNPIDFANTLVGDGAPDVGVTIHNEGASPIDILAITTTSPSVFPVTDLPGFPATLGGSDLGFTAGFVPAAPVPYDGVLTIATDEPSCAEFTIALSGLGESYGVTVAPAGWEAGSIEPDDSAAQEFTIENTGTLPVDVGPISIGDSTEFTLEVDFSTTTLAAGETATFTVTAHPTSLGHKQTLVTITTTSPDAPSLSVPVSADGICSGCQPDAGPGGPDADPEGPDSGGNPGDGDGGTDPPKSPLGCNAGGGASWPLALLLALFALITTRRRSTP
jgi:uncharacterized protein (TIGR03382 family)